jgi:hypothetical protein
MSDLDRLEDHSKRGLARQAALRSHRPVPYRRELGSVVRTCNNVRPGPRERQENAGILDRTTDGLRQACCVVPTPTRMHCGWSPVGPMHSRPWSKLSQCHSIMV